MRLLRVFSILKRNPYYIEEEPEGWERKKWDLPSKLVIWSVPIILGYSAFDGDGWQGFSLGNICGVWITFWAYQWHNERQEEKKRYIEYLKKRKPKNLQSEGK